VVFYNLESYAPINARHARDDYPKKFAMLDAYLDESGIHEGAVICVIAGYYAGRGQWKKFEKAWRRLLVDFAVPPEGFHAKDLLRGGGFFRAWNESQRQAFARSVANTIAGHHKIHPVSAAIIVDDFNQFSEKQRKVFTGASLTSGKLSSSGCPTKPYFLPFQHCIRLVACYAPVGGKADFFLGLGQTFSEYAEALFNQIKQSTLEVNGKERLGNIAFPEAKETPQLQAADFFVHLSYQHAVKRHAAGDLGRIPPPPLLALCIGNGKEVEDFAYYDKACLQKTLDQTYQIYGNWELNNR